MLVACWAAKGGSGTTTVVAALARLLGRRGPVLVADFGGDLPAVLGIADPPGPGLAEWLAAPADVPADALARVEIPLAPDLALLHRGHGELVAARAEALAASLAADSRTVVADCGTDPGGPALVVAACATRSVLVTRPCYVALRRAAGAPIHPSEIVLVHEPGRALGRADVEDVLGVPVTAELPLDPAVARAVDAGQLAGRLPRSLERALRSAA